MSEGRPQTSGMSQVYLLSKGVVGVNIDIIFRIAGIGILISVLSIVLKQAKKEEQAEMLTLAGVVVVLIIVVQLMNQLFTMVRSVFNL
jgi:stage III sporulation protein AC